MSDVFISYASADRKWVKNLANKLGAHGWSVWWDRNLVPGDTFDEKIERALNAARCVVVVWSRHSVESSWVRAEAGEGQKRGILLPIQRDNAIIPLAFRQIQAAQFQGWRGDVSAPEFQSLAKALDSILGGEHRHAQAERRPPKSGPKHFLALALASITFVAASYTAWRVWMTDDVFVSKRDSKVMVKVPGGKYVLGSNIDETQEVLPDLERFLGLDTETLLSFLEVERPQYEVILDDFYMDKYEVTYGEYMRFLWEEQRSVNIPAADDHDPVTGVNWQGAVDYCDWAMKDLPTEAQWEAAARGVARRKFPWGNSPVTPERANFCDEQCNKLAPTKHGDDGYSKVAPVGSYSLGATELGIHDLAGNVREWVQDDFYADSYMRAKRKNPVGGLGGEEKVVRGGGWASQPPLLRSAARASSPPAGTDSDLGFRCVVLVKDTQ